MPNPFAPNSASSPHEGQTPTTAAGKSFDDFDNHASPVTISEVISYDSEEEGTRLGPYLLYGSAPLSLSSRLASDPSTPMTGATAVESSLPSVQGSPSVSPVFDVESPRGSPFSLPKFTTTYRLDPTADELIYAPSKSDAPLRSVSDALSSAYDRQSGEEDQSCLQDVSQRLTFDAAKRTHVRDFTQFREQPSAFSTPRRDTDKKIVSPNNGHPARGPSRVDDMAFPDLRLAGVEGGSLFTDDSGDGANKTVPEHHARTMYQFAATLGYFPIMEEWDEILAELGGIDTVTVGKTNYNVHVAKDFLVAFRNAFCYLGRAKPVKHDPNLFTTLVEELEGKQFKGKDHAIKAWTDVFMNFNAVRIVLAMKIDKLKKDDRPSEGAERGSPVIDKLMRYLDLVREFEKDVWRMMPEEKRELVKRHFAKSPVATSHLKAVDVLSPPRVSAIDRSSANPLMLVSGSSSHFTPLALFSSPTVRSSRHSPQCEALRNSPVLQRFTYGELTDSRQDILRKQKNITPSHIVVGKDKHIKSKKKY